ncbi:hypothetical protein HK096_008708 [Nowakowskiella sp. JEL0078]|nr:hypothetical protein HK096_008708 [Nowakowskiella sp. JEL0078]
MLGRTGFIAAIGILISLQYVFALRYLPLGDSITGPYGCWRALLYQKLNSAGYDLNNIDFVGNQTGPGCSVPYDFNNEGHLGFEAVNIASQNLLVGWLVDAKPDIVTMFLGTNDCLYGQSTTSILAAYTTLVAQMRASNPKVVILVAQIIPMNYSSCVGCNSRVIDLNSQIPAWATSLTTSNSPITVVDQYTGFDISTDLIDGLHPNDPSGITKIANKWFTPFVSALKLLGVTPVRSGPSATFSCFDVIPPWGTCAQQLSWGNCAASWMFGYCQQTCGSCGTSSTITSTTSITPTSTTTRSTTTTTTTSANPLSTTTTKTTTSTTSPTTTTTTATTSSSSVVTKTSTTTSRTTSTTTSTTTSSSTCAAKYGQVTEI